MLPKTVLALGALSIGLGWALEATAGKKILERQVGHARIGLCDVVEAAPAALCAVDLGPSPLAGSSRLLLRDEMARALPTGTKLEALPEAVRVTRKTRSLGVTDIEKVTKDAVALEPLPRGATLVAVRPKGPVSIVEGFDSVVAQLPKVPRKSGTIAVIITLSFREGGVTVGSFDVPCELSLPSKAAVPDVKRGSSATLIVRRGLIEVHAVVTTGADADLGDEVAVTVADSNRVLRGRLAAVTPPVFEEVQP